MLSENFMFLVDKSQWVWNGTITSITLRAVYTKIYRYKLNLHIPESSRQKQKMY